MCGLYSFWVRAIWACNLGSLERFTFWNKQVIILRRCCTERPVKTQGGVGEGCQQLGQCPLNTSFIASNHISPHPPIGSKPTSRSVQERFLVEIYRSVQTVKQNSKRSSELKPPNLSLHETEAHSIVSDGTLAQLFQRESYVFL